MGFDGEFDGVVVAHRIVEGRRDGVGDDVFFGEVGVHDDAVVGTAVAAQVGALAVLDGPEPCVEAGVLVWGVVHAVGVEVSDDEDVATVVDEALELGEFGGDGGRLRMDGVDGEGVVVESPHGFEWGAFPAVEGVGVVVHHGGERHRVFVEEAVLFFDVGASGAAADGAFVVGELGAEGGEGVVGVGFVSDFLEEDDV